MGHAQRLTKKVLFISVILFIVGYVYYQSINLVKGPGITIVSPVNGETLSEPLVVFSGNTENISHIRMSGRPIFIDEEGAFSETLLVMPGLNIIEITAGDRFGRTTEKIVTLALKK